MIKITYTEKRTCYVDEAHYSDFVISESDSPELRTVQDYEDYEKCEMPSIKEYYEENLTPIQDVLNDCTTMRSLFRTYKEGEVPFVIKEEKPISELKLEIVS